MLVHEAAHLVYIAVDNDVQSLIDSVVFANVFRGELLRHYCGIRFRLKAALPLLDGQIPTPATV